MTRQLVCVLGLLLLPPTRARSQQADPGALPTAQARVSFTMDRVGVDVSHLVLTVNADGSGSYEALAAPETLSSRYGTEATSVTPESIRREIHLSAAGVAKVFAGAHATDLFHASCNSKAKNIADTGRKTLSYEGPDGKGSCTYNYSENKVVGGLTDYFQGVAYTIEEGRRLEFRHRYDRLGLDQEMATLTAQADAGRAPELGTIAAVLDSLVADGDLLERVRLRARKLLDRAQANP